MIVVLTLGRSGSSLIMQTLKHLGADVFGFAFGRDPSAAHIALNPKGYFEDGPLYEKGLRSFAFSKLSERAHRTLAFKSDLRNFSDPSASAAWLDASDRISAVLISIRTPEEQARSEILGMASDETGARERDLRVAEFQRATFFLRSYRTCLADLQRQLEGPLAGYRMRCRAIDYKQARLDPEGYVARIAMSAGLDATGRQRRAARDNIELGLYRHRAEALQADYGVWAQDLGALKAYDDIKALLGG